MDNVTVKFAMETEPEFNSVSVAKISFIEHSGRTFELGRDRRAFTPDQITQLAEYAPPLKDACAALWTPEVIAKWEEHIAELEPNQ